MRTFLACSSEPLLNGLSVCGTTDAPVRPRFLPLNVLILSEVFFFVVVVIFPLRAATKRGRWAPGKKERKETSY